MMRTEIGHTEVAEDSGGPPGATWSVDDIKLNYGPRFVAAFSRSDDGLRQRYYDISKTWHDKWDTSGKASGGQYGQQWLQLIEATLGLPAGSTKRDDFGALHVYLFRWLAALVLMQTSHDIDPDALDGGELDIGLLSFHNIPNDSTHSVITPSTDLGFPP